MNYTKASWPMESELGLIQTKNSMGIMTTELSPIALAFVNDAKVSQGSYLDIGAAYGVATHRVLDTGAKITACDISKTHLEILYDSSSLSNRHNLTIDHNDFPYNTNYSNNTFNGILISLVLHFLNGPAIEEGLKKCYKWLRPGGKVYISVMTPNLSFYNQCWPAYKQRVLKGEKWPGIFKKSDFMSNQYLSQIPDMVHLFDDVILAKLVSEAGFKLIHNDFFCYNYFPEKHRTNGKEFLGVIGVR